MKLTIPKSEFARLAALVRPVIPRKSDIPALEHIRFEHLEGVAHAFATNLDQSVIVPLACEASGSMHASVPNSVLQRVAREADKDTAITLTVVDNEPGTVRRRDSQAGCEVSWTSLGVPTTHTEPIIPLVDFPPVSTEGYSTGMMLNAEAVALLRGAASHISTDETRFVLNGVFFAKSGNFVATDGRRLFLGASPNAIPCDAIVPTSMVDLMLQHIGKDGGPVWFKMPEKTASTEGLKADMGIKDECPMAESVMVCAGSGNAFILSRCITEGNFPNFRQVIPTQAHYIGRVTMDLKDLLRRLGQVGGGSSMKVWLHGGKMRILPCFPTDDERAHTKQEWQEIGETLNPDVEMIAAFNTDFFCAALRAVSGDDKDPLAARPDIYFIDEISPVVIQRNRSQVVLMPMRVNT